MLSEQTAIDGLTMKPVEAATRQKKLKRMGLRMVAEFNSSSPNKEQILRHGQVYSNGIWNKDR